MWENLSEFPTWASGFGVLGLLGWLVFRTMNYSSVDRKEYQEALKKERERHDTELAQLRADYDKRIDDLQEHHDNQMDALRSQLATVQAHVGVLTSTIEETRKLRWQAEDAAARWRRRAIAAGVSDSDE